MKIIFIVIAAVLLPFYSISQTFEAQYKVSEDIYANLGNGELKKALTLDYTGYFYRKGGRYIYFEKPNYLNTYPSGKFEFNTSEYSVFGISLAMDTLQSLSSRDMDSLIFRMRPHMSGKGQVSYNYMQKFDSNFFQWDLFPETKIVNGLKCQKATLTLRGKPQWSVWFTSDIPMQAGIDAIMGLPGLVVEADCIPLKKHYSLVKYSANTPIADKVFWPAEFNQRFEKLSDMKAAVPSGPVKKTKLEQQTELSNQ
ncbi:GLPGLI family protein [Pedobacter jeongneungensis]|uniref:GLPGLI family protein n=1 Tax=Pedobacter jeongneungensis TaxID=947309 RepID=UPI00046A450E|nr:GLPGLI family protein [Pedobacter jeongneungensis]